SGSPCASTADSSRRSARASMRVMVSRAPTRGDAAAARKPVRACRHAVDAVRLGAVGSAMRPRCHPTGAPARRWHAGTGWHLCANRSRTFDSRFRAALHDRRRATGAMSDDADKTVQSISDDWSAAGDNRLPVLIVLRGAHIGRRYLLNEQAMVIGRREAQASVVIAGDPAISAAHCRIEHDPIGDDYALVDLGSTNGTRLNGEPVTRRTTLHDGDKILLGGAILKFTFHDVVEAEFHREVDRMMNIDELTGLVVLRVFEERFRRALTACSAAGRPL